MKATCVDCGSALGSGYYIELNDFKALKAGKEAEIIPVMWCPKCGHLAFEWDDNWIQFYEERK